MISEYLGLTFAEALRAARLAGCPPGRIRIICPPWPVLGQGALRVVCVRPLEEPEWLLAYEDYLRIKEDA